MTRQPPNPQAQFEARARAALVKNLLGLLLMVVAAVGLGVIAWTVDWRLLAAGVLAAVAALGYHLATIEAE